MPFTTKPSRSLEPYCWNGWSHIHKTWNLLGSGSHGCVVWTTFNYALWRLFIFFESSFFKKCIFLTCWASNIWRRVVASINHGTPSRKGFPLKQRLGTRPQSHCEAALVGLYTLEPKNSLFLQTETLVHLDTSNKKLFVNIFWHCSELFT